MQHYPPISTLFTYTTLFRSHLTAEVIRENESNHRRITRKERVGKCRRQRILLRDREFIFVLVRTHAHRKTKLFEVANALDRKSKRLNSSHLGISYAVFCLKI